jgi:periplasmic divalent cation tolerance protein
MALFIQIITTTDKKETADSIARDLVGKRLAACVQILGPIESTYRWKGQIETAAEWLCLVKSREDCFEDIVAAIKAIHTYETPEILAVPVLAGSKDYLEWLESEVNGKHDDYCR